MASSKRSNGEGSIFQQHGPNCPPPVEKVDDAGKRRQVRPPHKCDGKWVASVVVGWRGGRPVRRKRIASSRAKAAQKLREMTDSMARGQVPVAKTMTVEQWMTYYLEEIVRKTRRASTYEGYVSSNEQYIVPLLGHYRLDRLQPEHVEQAWDELQEVGNPTRNDPRPLSSTTALQTHRILSRALTIAVRREHINRNVCTLIDAPSAADTDVEPLSRVQALRVLERARGRRNAARWSVALAIGLRQGEALGLTWNDDPDDPGDVDLESGTLTVRHALQRIRGKGLVLTSTKSRASQRTLSLPAPLVAELKAHRAAQNAERLRAGTAWHDGPSFVFTQTNGRPIDPKQDWTAWSELLTAAEVPHRRLHDARHTAGTLLLLQGVPTRTAMDILGHSQISVTMKYQHVVDDMKKDAANRIGAALWDTSSGS